MKKVFPCIFLILFLLTGCADTTEPFGENTDIVDFTDGYIFESTTTKSYGLLSCDNNAAENDIPVSAPSQPGDTVTDRSISQEKFRGVWLSYYEINVSQGRSTREKYASYIDTLCDAFQPYGITDAFVHVRAYADAMYKSSVYPSSVYAAQRQGEELPFDPLEVICEVMGKKGIRVHAWINPYRVLNGTDITQLSQSSKARQWYTEGSNEDVAVVGDKIYFNPASEKAQQLVVEGAREILLNYPVSGIHIDDYFYPPSCGDFDSRQYSDYISRGGALCLEDWRRDNINKLVRSLYSTVKSFGSDKIFSISPAGNIENNYNSLYADVVLWCKGGYADMIIPQIYFGFDHGTHAFDKCTEQWLSLKGESVMMPVGLALYKSGTKDSFAGDGEKEWQENTDIITRQVQYLRSRDCGFAVFSAEYFISPSAHASAELENLRKYLNG